MVVEKESEIKVLRNFYENPFDYFSIAEISRRISLSRNWTYKVMEKFEKEGILAVSGKKYRLDFGELFCKRLKLLFDSEYLNSLNPELKDAVFNTTNKLIFEINPKSIILVGSVAMNKQRKESDIDFLVIGENKEIPYFENCNIVLATPNELQERYLKGDDFIISALSFGKVVYDNNFFIKLYEKPLPIFSEEIIQEKIRYCERLKERVYTLLKTDEKKAGEELAYLALQAARIILLRKKIMPKTKYDIARQVKQFNPELAKIVEELVENKKLRKERLLEYIKICMGVIR